MLDIRGLEQVAIILFAGVVGARIAEEFRIPIIIPLLITGYILGPELLGIFDPASLGLSLSFLVVLLIPVILFNESIRTDSRRLMEVKVSVLLLVTLGVAISTVATGLLYSGIFGGSLLLALLLGAVLSPTDPAAVTALTKKLRIDESIATIAEAESALNDATAIILTEMLAASVLGEMLDVQGAVLEFALLFFGGLFVGFAIAVVIREVVLRLELEEHMVYISLATFVVVYLAAEAVGVSGPTALVSAGITLGGFLRSLRIRHRENVLAAWENIAFIAQAVIFLVLGASMSLRALADVAIQAFVLLALLCLLVRPLTVTIGLAPTRGFNFGEVALLSVLGAKGAVTAGLGAYLLGLGVPRAKEMFNLVLVIIFLTMIFSSILAEPLARRFAETRIAERGVREYYELVADYYSSICALRELEEMHHRGRVDPVLYERAKRKLVEELERVRGRLSKIHSDPRYSALVRSRERALLADLAKARIDSLRELLERGLIDEATYRRKLEEFLEVLEGEYG